MALRGNGLRRACSCLWLRSPSASSPRPCESRELRSEHAGHRCLGFAARPRPPSELTRDWACVNRAPPSGRNAHGRPCVPCVPCVDRGQRKTPGDRRTGAPHAPRRVGPGAFDFVYFCFALSLISLQKFRRKKFCFSVLMVDFKVTLTFQFRHLQNVPGIWLI